MGRHKRPTLALAKRHAGFRDDLTAQGIQTRGVDEYCAIADAFLSWLGKKDPAKVGLGELRDYLLVLQKRGLQPKTLGKHFSALASFYQYLETEGKIAVNPVPSFRRRYLRAIKRQANKNQAGLRQLLSVEDMAALAHSIMDAEDRAMLVLFAKTGIRRQELINIDLEDVDWTMGKITLKPTPKRTNLVVFFDDETVRVLKRWLPIRAARGAQPDTGPLFTGKQGGRIDRNQVTDSISDAAAALGFHDPEGSLKARFTPHCSRHWFTTHLERAGLRPTLLDWLRGDAPKGTRGIYTHIDENEAREEYRKRIPQLGF